MFTKSTNLLNAFLLPAETPAAKPAPASGGNVQPFSDFLTHSFSEFIFPNGGSAENREVPVAEPHQEEPFRMAPVAVAGLYPFPEVAPAAGISRLDTGTNPSPGGLPTEGRDLNAMSAFPLPGLLAGEPGTAETGIGQPGNRAVQNVSPGRAGWIVPVRKEKITFAAPVTVEIQPGKETPFNPAGASPGEDGGTPDVLPVAGRPGPELRRQQGIFGADLAPADLILEHAPGRPVSSPVAGTAGIVNAAEVSNPPAAGVLNPNAFPEGSATGVVETMARSNPFRSNIVNAGAASNTSPSGLVNALPGSSPAPSGLSEAMPSGISPEFVPFPTPVRHPDALRARVILQTAREVHIGAGDKQGVASPPVSRAPESIFATPGKVSVPQSSGRIRDAKGAVSGPAAPSAGRTPRMRLLGQKAAGGIAETSGPHPLGIFVEGDTGSAVRSPSGASVEGNAGSAVRSPSGAFAESIAGGPAVHPPDMSVAGANGASEKPDPLSQLRVAPGPSQQNQSAGDLRFGAASRDDLHGADVIKQNPDRPALRENLPVGPPAGARSAFTPQVSRPTIPVAPGMVVNPPVFQPISPQINPAAGAFLLKEAPNAPSVKPGTVVRYALLSEEPSQPLVSAKAASADVFGEHPVAAPPEPRIASDEAAHSGPGKETPPPAQKAPANGVTAPQGAPPAPGTTPLLHAAAVRALDASPHPLGQQQPGAAVPDEDGVTGTLPQAERISENGKNFAASSAKGEESPVPGKMSRPVPGIAPANPASRPAQGSRSQSRKAVPSFAENTAPALRADGGPRTVREPLSQQNGSFFAGPGGDEEAVILPVSGEEAPAGTEAFTGGSKTSTPLPVDGSGAPSGKLPVVTFRSASQFTGRLAVFFQEQFNQLARHPNSAGAHLMLQLEPRELGVIRLKLRMKNNRLVGEIETGLAETSTLLHQNQGQLISRLQEMGVQIQDFQIVHNENMADQQQFAREQQAHHGQSGGAGNRGKDAHKADLSPDPVAPRVEAGRIDVMV